MDQHPFDVYARVAAKTAAALPVETWSPPEISDAGHLIYAEPRGGATPPSEPQEPKEPDEAELIRKQAYDDGFSSGKNAGFEAGKKEGMLVGKEDAMAAAKRDMQPKLKELNTLLTTLSHSLNEEDYNLEKTLMDLVQQIACSVIRQELSLGPGSLMKVIKETIAALPASGDSIKIHLNPQDKVYADEAIESGGENWRAVPDEDIERGGCKIVTDHSEVDLTVSERIEAVLEQLYEQQAVSPKPGEPGFESAPEPAVNLTSTPQSTAQSSSPDSDSPDLSQSTGD